MKTTSVHCKGVAAPAAAGHQIRNQRATIKLGVDIHTRLYIVAAQYDHAALKPPKRLAPAEFLPWVESLVRAGHRVHVVYEACGFGLGLCWRLNALGATCYVIAPRKLDEARKGVKTDALDG